MVKVKTIMEVEAPTIKVDDEKRTVEGLRCTTAGATGGSGIRTSMARISRIRARCVVAAAR